MNLYKILMIVLVMLPNLAVSQEPSNQNKFPLYDNALAADLWSKWKAHSDFDQDMYAKAIFLCDVSFGYLVLEYNEIMCTTKSKDEWKVKGMLLDEGVTSSMSNFARTFSVWLQNLGNEGALSEDNMKRIEKMKKKKRVFMDIFRDINHPEAKD